MSWTVYFSTLVGYNVTEYDWQRHDNERGVAMTKQEAEQMQERLRQIFPIVRLLEETAIPENSEDIPSGETAEGCQCFAFWNKTIPCANCISREALRTKGQLVKIEFLDDEIYQVISKYTEVEGKPCVVEMLEPLDEETLMDSDGREKLMKRLSGYDDKLYRDALTGIYNRRFYEERVRHMTRHAGVAMIDLDDFKLYNDTYGHNAGDMVLDTIVGVIQNTIRKTDMLIRFGGDEFLLVLPEISEDAFELKLKRIRQHVQETKIVGYTQLKLSVSIGGVMSGGEPIEETLERADRLMYQAKIRKNAVVTQRNEVQTNRNELPEETERLRILIADDSENNRELLAEMLQDGYDIVEAEDGEKAIEQLHEYGKGISLVLLDLLMPVMDGFDVLAYMGTNKWLEDIPVIMISSEDSAPYVKRAYELGATDYIGRPFDANVVYRRVQNTIKLYAKQRRLTTLVTNQIYEKEKNNQMMISILSQIVEFRNGESGLHVMRINMITGMLLERLAVKSDKYPLSWAERSMITMASSLHDIGKIGIPEEILNKPGKLTKEEFEIMKQHSAIGADMLRSLKRYQNEELVKVAYEICRWHHERYDGKGYPDGLKGEEIPISAQVVSLADVYDALVSERVYKKAFSPEKALEMIKNGECGSFNPLLLECLVDIKDRVKEEYEQREE